MLREEKGSTGVADPQASLKHENYKLIFVNMKEFRNYCSCEYFLKIPMNELYSAERFAAPSKQRWWRVLWIPHSNQRYRNGSEEVITCNGTGKSN